MVSAAGKSLHHQFEKFAVAGFVTLTAVEALPSMQGTDVADERLQPGVLKKIQSVVYTRSTMQNGGQLAPA
jgi:hypothetical protein